MEISEDRAYWMLHSYRARGACLHFGGTLLEQDSVCATRVSMVDRQRKILTVQLLSDKFQLAATISLLNATFSLAQFEQDSRRYLNERGWRSVLFIEFPDRTTFYVAERIVRTVIGAGNCKSTKSTNSTVATMELEWSGV